jgi:hypothetical protein
VCGYDLHAGVCLHSQQSLGDASPTQGGTAGDVKLDFTEALITQDTLRIDVDLAIGGDLTLVTRPGILVDTDGLTGKLGEVKVRHVTDPRAPVALRVELAGRIRGGGIVARLPRRTFWQWLLRKPRPYRSLTG